MGEAVVLFLVRGLPGAGKTTLAERLRAAGLVSAVVSADDFLMVRGRYVWRADRLEAAHEQCRRAVAARLAKRESVAVANVFARREHLVPYQVAAEAFGARVVEVSVFDAGLSDEALAASTVHAVPAAVIGRMRRGWEL